jgi:aryl carrier-like protein
MTRAGAAIRVVAADIADRIQAEQAVAAAEQAGRLRGIIHAAGVLDDGVLLRQSAERFAAVMSGKVRGAMHLDRLTRGRDLDFFVLFSSASATLGSPGQANYAAANATLDALAAERRRCGEAAISIAWGPWAETGMAARLGEAQRAALDAGPLTPLPVAQATRLLGRLLHAPTAQIAAMRFDPTRLRPERHGALLPLTAGLSPAAASAELAAAIAPIAMPTDRAGVIAYLERCSRALLRLRHDQVLHTVTPLQEQGFDSIMAMELRNRIAHELGEDVPIQRLIDGSTIEGLADLLHTRLALARAAAPVSADDAELEELVL